MKVAPRGGPTTAPAARGATHVRAGTTVATAKWMSSVSTSCTMVASARMTYPSSGCRVMVPRRPARRHVPDQAACGSGQTGNTMRPKMASSQNTADSA